MFGQMWTGEKIGNFDLNLNNDFILSPRDLFLQLIKKIPFYKHLILP